MKRIIFVTENQNDFQLAKRSIDPKTISLVQAPKQTIPTLDDNLQDLVASKLIEAYSKLQEPCFIVESSFMIEALHQFPGIMIDYVLKTIGTDGLLKLMEAQENRSCLYRQTLGYYDGNEVHYFYNDIKGTLATKKAGDPSTDHLEQIFIPESFQLLLEAEPNNLKPAYQPDCIGQFASYLNNHLFTLIDDPYHEN